MTYRDFKTSGVRVGRLFGIDIWLHWLFLILLAFNLHGSWTTEKSWSSMGEALLGTACVFGIILLHEFGHCYAAHRMGGGADAVVLWPLGGLAYCVAPNIPRAQFWVAAGGPLVNVGIAILYEVLVVPFVLPQLSNRFLVAPLLNIGYWNLFLLIFNLLPMWPLDGGRIFQAIVWGKTKSLGKASQMTVYVTWGTIALTLILSLTGNVFPRFGPLTIFILFWCVFETEKLRRHLKESEEDYVFGYDFSRGYTSLGRTGGPVEKPRKPTFFERRRQRRREREKQQKAEMRQRVDSLLDKISAEGMQSLSAKERAFLEEASRRLGD